MMNNYQNYYWLPNNMRENIVYPLINQKDFNTQSLFPPKEALEKGNLFEDLYSKYKDYSPAVLTPKTSQEGKLQQLQAISFAAHDLNLYLDTHPEDQSMVALFNDYRRQKEELMREYEREYGPLTVDSEAMEGNTYSWTNSPWPWEGKNV